MPGVPIQRCKSKRERQQVHDNQQSTWQQGHCD